jgi:hypothetical protein
MFQSFNLYPSICRPIVDQFVKLRVHLEEVRSTVATLAPRDKIDRGVELKWRWVRPSISCTRSFHGYDHISPIRHTPCTFSSHGCGGRCWHPCIPCTGFCGGCETLLSLRRAWQLEALDEACRRQQQGESVHVTLDNLLRRSELCVACCNRKVLERHVFDEVADVQAYDMWLDDLWWKHGCEKHDVLLLSRRRKYNDSPSGWHNRGLQKTRSLTKRQSMSKG